MLKNYFKIAIAVLKRRKFFTFISLFGISFTLTILIVLTAFIDHLLSPSYPDAKRSKELFVTAMREQSSKGGWSSMGPLSVYFFKHYVSPLKVPEKVAISSMFTSSNTYVNNKKLVIDLKYTNDQYWDVYDYKFIEGKPFNKQQLDNSEKVAVISEDTKKDYFGDATKVVGEYIETDNIQYRVIGVVKSEPVTNMYTYADIYLPYTLSKANVNSQDLRGNYVGTLLARSEDDLPKMKEEFEQMIKKIPINSKDFDQRFNFADTYLHVYTRQIFSKGSGTGMTPFIISISVFALLFMLLPTINLVNINMSRIMERSSEIGVRKAFGASSKTLTYQFIVENLILTIIGGFTGILLSWAGLQMINNGNLIDNMHLSINLTVLFYSLVACLIFGLLSGVYPAWRMSKLAVVTALKAQ